MINNIVPSVNSSVSEFDVKDDSKTEGGVGSFELGSPDIQDELLFQADRKITLRCGKSSITLYPNGKIVLRGEYILSDAEGVNRIAGGQIELN